MRKKSFITWVPAKQTSLVSGEEEKYRLRLTMTWGGEGSRGGEGGVVASHGLCDIRWHFFGALSEQRSTQVDNGGWELSYMSSRLPLGGCQCEQNKFRWLRACDESVRAN